MNSDKKNYYDILEISTNATQAEIERAYNSALIAYAEDSVAIYSLMSSDDCKEIRSLIVEAHSILGTPEKRREYDRHRGLNQEVQSLDDKANSESKGRLPSFDFNEASISPFSDADFGTNYRNSTSTTVSSIKKNSEINVEEAKKKFALNYVVDEDMEQKIQNTTEFSGAFLRAIREYRNVTIDKMSEMTRIMKTYINYIENEEFEKLPATAYVRGFIFQYSKHLKLNPDLVSQLFMQRVKTARGELLQKIS
jgi:curved DNA-binding protein CbpA